MVNGCIENDHQRQPARHFYVLPPNLIEFCFASKPFSSLSEIHMKRNVTQAVVHQFFQHLPVATDAIGE